MFDPLLASAVTTLSAAALFTTPLLIAATGELVAERAGVVNIGIEGMMLAGALAAFVTSALLLPALGPAAVLVGMAAAMAVAMALGLIFAWTVIPMAADQIVAGTGINLIAFGGTALAYKALSAKLAATGGDPPAQAGVWYMAIASMAIILTAWAYFRFTRSGLELSAIGEAPQAADAAGVVVGRRKLGAVLVGAACAGLAGAYLSTLRVWSFTENMTEGQGFLALAIVIFGRWNALGVLAAAVFFGVVRAVALEAEAQRGALHPLVQWILESAGPAHRAAAMDAIKAVLKALPYAVTLLALAGVAGRSGSPAALGRAYSRE